MNERDESEPADFGAGGISLRWDHVSHWLIRRASTAAPSELATRLEEEWLADLSARSSMISRLRFALGCCWATAIIAHERRTAVPVASTAVGPRIAAANLFEGAGYFSRRSLTLLLVIAMHAAIFVALMNAVVTKSHKIAEAPIVPKFIPDTHPRVLPKLPQPVVDISRLVIPQP